MSVMAYLTIIVACAVKENKTRKCRRNQRIRMESLKKRSNFSDNNLLREIKNVSTNRKQILFMNVSFYCDDLLEWLCLLLEWFASYWNGYASYSKRIYDHDRLLCSISYQTVQCQNVYTTSVVQIV
jgi:hypothetical protein